MSQDTHIEYLVIGAGPAGLQLGYCFEKSGREYLILERSTHAGSFFDKYPRHRTLISINKAYTGLDNYDQNMRFDWNSLICDDPALLLKNYSKEYFPPADKLVEYLGDFAKRYDLKIRYNTTVTKISRHGSGYRLDLADGTSMTCDRLVVATGRWVTNKPDIPGIELCEDYADFSVDPKDYIDERVMIVGKGNSAFETADGMVGTSAAMHLCSPTPIRLAWKTHYVGHLRAINNSLLDTYQLKSGNTILDATIESVRRDEDTGKLIVRVHYTHAEGQTRDIPVDRVLLCAGFLFDTSLFAEDAMPAVTPDGKFPVVTTEWESSNQPNMFFAGNLMHGLDHEKTFSGFIHGFRYNVVALESVFGLKFHDAGWPHEANVSLEPAAFADAILERVDKVSSMYQQPGFIGDVITVDNDGKTGTWYHDVPMAHVAENGWLDADEYWTLVLDYGRIKHSDPFNIQRFPFSKGGEDSTFLHPILCRYKNGQLVSRHEVSQDLENLWIGDRFRAPLLAFLEELERDDDGVRAGAA